MVISVECLVVLQYRIAFKGSITSVFEIGRFQGPPQGIGGQAGKYFDPV